MRGETNCLRGRCMCVCARWCCGESCALHERRARGRRKLAGQRRVCGVCAGEGGTISPRSSHRPRACLLLLVSRTRARTRRAHAEIDFCVCACAVQSCRRESRARESTSGHARTHICVAGNGRITKHTQQHHSPPPRHTMYHRHDRLQTPRGAVL